LGAGSSVGPRSVLSVALVTLWSASLVFIVIIVALRWHIPKIFTSEEGVIELSAKILPLLAAFQIFDGTVGVCSGAIRGAGLQLIGAAVCFVTLYVIGAPVSLCMVFLAKYELEGLWVGLTLGTVLEGVFYCIITHTINWEKQVQLAQERTVKVMGKQSKTLYYNDVFTNAGYISEIGEEPNDLVANDGSLTLPVVQQEDLINEEIRYVSGRKMLILKRLILVVILLGMIIISICCRLLIPWSSVLGTFCILPNGSFYRVNGTNVTENCTMVIM
uniref:Multidrug and toxin extrusion protein n=1 Tax=Echinostoma caproni TaxID=27848 RepID=A0A183AWZ4_9TREM